MTLPRFVQPRRFAEVWQMSEDWPGTLAQQQAVRDALTPIYGSQFHRLTQKLDRHVNQRGRSYLTVSFAPIGDYLGRAGTYGILLSDRLKDPVIIRNYVRHESGHVYDQLDLLSQLDKWQFMDLVSGHHNGNWPNEYQETWADAYRDWINTDGQTWAALTPMLLPAAA